MWNNPITTSLFTAIVPAVIIGLFTKVIFPILLERFSKKREISILLTPGAQQELEEWGNIRIKRRIRRVATLAAILTGLITFFIFRPTIYSYINRPSGEVVEGFAGQPTSTIEPFINFTDDVYEPTPQIEPTVEVMVLVPTTTPMPTMVSLSSLSLLKSDDYSSTDSEWDYYYNADGSTGYEDGKYFIELNKRILFLSVWGGGGQHKDGVFQTEILGPLDPTGIIRQGIGVGWQTGWTNKVYATTVDNNGFCHIYENVDKTRWVSRFSRIAHDFDDALDSHILTLVIDESGKASVYVDDIFCAEYTLDDYEGGRVGVVALGSKDGGKAYFDNYQIYSAP